MGRGVRILVTGITDFTVGHLARFLAGRGHAVRGLARPASRDRPAVPSRAGIDVVLGDLTDPASLALRVRRPSTSSTTSPRRTAPPASGTTPTAR